MRHYNLKKEKTLVTFSNTGFHWKGTKSKDMDVLAICVAIIATQIVPKADIIMEVASLTSQKNKNNIKDKTSAK